MVLFGLQPESRGFSKAEDLVRSLHRTVRRWIGVESVKTLANFVEEAAHAGTHILGMATSLGLSANAFQTWSLVARRAGSDASQFTVGVSQFERFLKDFAAGRGGKRFKDAMRDVGLSVEDAKQALSSPDGINNALFKVADAYQKMGNNAKRAAISTSLFGQRARGITQDLSQGSAALRAQIEEFKRNGQIMSEDDLRRLKKVDNTILDLKVSVKNLLMEAVAAFGPQLVAMLQDALQWFRENKDLISGAFTAALQTVAFLFRVIGEAIVKVQAFFQAAFNGDAGAIALMTVFAMTISATVLPALAKMAFSLAGPIITGLRALAPALETIVFMIGSIGKAMLAFMLSPAGLILTAIGAIAVGVYEIYEHWEAVRDAIIAAKDAIAEFFGEDKNLEAEIHKNFKGSWIERMVPPTAPAAAGLSPPGTAAAAASQETNVTVTQHITNQGVKNAEHAAGLMGDATDRAIRHAVGNTGRTPK